MTTRLAPLAVLAVFFGIATSTDAAVRIVESTDQRLSFEFSMEDLQVAPFVREGGKQVVLDFDGSNTEVGGLSEPVLPALSLYAGVPASGGVQIRFTPLNTERIELAGPVRVRSNPDAQPDSSQPTFAAGSFVSSPFYSRIQGLRTMQVVLKPFLYEPGSRSITVLRSGQCTIEFPATGRMSGAPVRGELSSMLRSLLLNYETAKSWRARGLAKSGLSAAATPLRFNNSLLTFDIGDGNTGFNEATTDENGLVRISGEDIIAILGSGLRFSSVSLFGSVRGTLPEKTPAADAIPAGVTRVPVLIEDSDNDGIIDSEDGILAYVTGGSDWVYDRPWKEYFFSLNHYDDKRHYWLARNSSGREMPRHAPPDGKVIDTLESSIRHTMFRQSNRLPSHAEGGTEWIWMQFTSAVQQETFTLDLSDVDTSAPGKLRLHSSSHPSYSPTVEVRMAGNELCKSCSQQEWRQVEEWAPEVSIKFPTASDTLELEAIELRYSQRLDMNGRTRLQVFSATDSGLIAYRLTGLPEEKVFIVRIPAADSAISLIDTLPAGATEAVWVDSGGTGTQYFVCTESAVTTIAPRRFDPKSSDDQWLVRDLRSSRSRSEYLIVTHELFTSEAIRLAKHKRDVRKFANPRVVDIDDIFRQFAGGNRDPVALRNFLAHANSAWGPLAYVVLMGSGHFDYKGHFRSISETNFIPVIQDGEKAIDDFYGFLEAGEGFSNDSSMLDVFLGRIPCKTRNEAKTVVDKIVAMEAPDADFGAWRNRVLLVADDDLQGNVIDPISPPHYLSCEGVESRILNQRKSVEMSKIYLYDYPFDRQLKKPEVNRALVNRINSGVSVVNYFGHGADNLWSDEHIFVPEMVTELTNRNRYPIVTSFSCSVGRFDDPRNDCLSGMLVNEQGAGAIASIASTRVAYAGDNDALAKSFYGILFERNEGRTVGEALAEAKIHQTRNYRLNQRTYVLLGDPSIRMTNIVDSVEVRIEDEDGKQLDSLKALQQVRITGKIADGSIGKSGSAMIHLGLYNPVRDSVKRKDGGANQNISYALPGTPVFIGQAKLTNGNFTQNVLLPRSVTFREPGVTLIAYAWDGNRMATGVRDDYVFNGSVSTKITDEQGPRIMVKPVYLTENMRAGAGYREKISGQLPLQLNIELFDQSGIDVVGTGPDEGLTIELEEALERQNINHKFQFHEGDYRRGSATMQLNEGELEPGTYAMQVTAQDLVGNVEKLQMDLTITETNSTEDFRFEHVFNYPNPVKMGKTTRFYFHQTGDHQSDLEFTIRIFTLSGKMLRVIRNAVNGQVWDLTDSRGNRLAPNMYLYRVTATAGRGQYSTTTPMEKLVIHPPR